MALEPSDLLQSLESERDRLEQMLDSVAAWRALCQLDAREADGRPVSAVDAARLRSRLEEALEADRVFLARRKLIEAIELLLDARAPGEARPVDPAVTAVAVSSCSAPVERPPIVDTPPSADDTAKVDPADDLTMIRGIDRALAARLHGLGVHTFDDIARWTAAEVRDMSARLDAAGRISRQNWIEQAALLAMRLRGRIAGAPAGRATPVSPSLDRTPQPASPTASPAAVSRLSRPVGELVAKAARDIFARARRPSAPAVPPDPPADDLTRIRGILPETASALADAGVRRFADIAAWSAADVARVRLALGSGAAISRDQWIEQSALLATGAMTHHVRQAALLLGLPLAPSPSVSAIDRDEAFATHLASTSAAMPPLAALPVPAPAVTRPALAPLEVPVFSEHSGPAQAAPALREFPTLELPLLELPEQPPAAADATAPPAGLDAMLYEPFDLGLSEADVAIVARASSLAAPEPAGEKPKSIAPGRSPSLAARLRRAGAPDGFDGESYAAYRGEVEEASVDIVHRTPVADRAPHEGPDASASETTDGGVRTVRRFLKALTGQSR